ncbi:hypothetical protein N1037_03480 [Phaeobacter sp. G2]|nr:hypothetical protein N1037_03480 [Phaeobacter sp. G2]
MASVEVMTACENVCRDFSWLVLSSPRVIQGALTLCAAFLASGTALWIAYRAYPAQKIADRILQEAHERREAYRRFLQAANEHYARLTVAHWTKDLTGVTDSYFELISVTADLAAYVPAGEHHNALDRCQMYLQTLLEYKTKVEADCGVERAQKWVKKEPNKYRSDLYLEVKSARKKAFIAIRMELGETREVAENAAKVFFVKTPEEEKP